MMEFTIFAYLPYSKRKDEDYEPYNCSNVDEVESYLKILERKRELLYIDIYVSGEGANAILKTDNQKSHARLLMRLRGASLT